MNYYTPFKQLNPIAQVTKMQSMQAQRAELVAESLNDSAAHLRLEMSKSMDITRFSFVYGLGQPMEAAKLTTLLDDFVFMASAEKSHPDKNVLVMAKFMCMAKLAIELAESQADISLNVANLIHESCDIARERLPLYATETLGTASVAMQSVWDKRSAALQTRADKRRTLRLNKK